MAKKYRIGLVVLLVVGILFSIGLYLNGSNLAVLNPKGTIAEQQKDLMIGTALLSLVVVVPVFIMTFGIAWKYRAGNSKAKYTPEWDHSRVAETIWWVVPLILILILSVVTWITSHTLDPFKSLDSSVKPVKIQVVALQWKWLFIYPEENIATVNYVRFPDKTPIDFEITSDAPMNSFWIPQLGGQIYAMSGMSTELHLMADEPGKFQGSSANLSGEGFADMNFIAESSTRSDYDTWVASLKASGTVLNQDEYNKLAAPSKNVVPAIYSTVDSTLYHAAIMKYMAPSLEAKTGEMEYEPAHH